LLKKVRTSEIYCGKPGQVLLTPGQYRLLGARIVFLLEGISGLPLLPIHTKPGPEALGEATRLEVEYGLALMGYMLEVARGFYNNMISLEGRANKTAILLVEFWWWLHRKAEYMERVTRNEVTQGCRGQVLSVIIRFCRTQISGARECFSITWPMVQ
jgi:hypothetical protein